jgi:hypothetical protein
MDCLLEEFVPASTYNKLPHISEVSSAPEDHSKDLEDLRTLLAKHAVPKDVSVRLIHKHFDTKDGEIMVFDKLMLPNLGAVQTMKPVLPFGNEKLRGIHYFVNDAGLLQAYEYSTCEVPDMSKFGTFLTEFSQLVQERNLQHKFGLKLKVQDELDRRNWTEYEFHQKRSTIMLQEGMPMPDGDSDFTVNTEWKATQLEEDVTRCKHQSTCNHGASKCKHCRHCGAHDLEHGLGNGLFLGGHEILPGTPIFDIVNMIAVQAF